MTRRSQHKRRGLTRRQVIQGLTLVGGLCGGAAATALLRNRPRVVVLPHEDDMPVASPVIVRPPVVSRAEWGALPINHQARNEYGLYQPGSNSEGWYVYEGSLRESYQTLIVHHSSFYEADGLATIREVERLHRDDRMWADIGYHFLVDVDGRIYEGRDLAARGVHTMGYNTGSAGVCLLGDFRFVPPAAAQWEGMVALGSWLVAELALSHLAGHRQFNESTLCPGGALLARLPEMASWLSLEYGTAGYVPTAHAGDGCRCCCDAVL